MPTLTIRDIAREAGVGVGTVSRVLNNKTHVSPETRERVLAVVRHRGFRRNKSAVQLSSGSYVRSVGIVLPNLTHYSFVERLRGVQAALSASHDNWELVLYSVSSPKSYEDQLISITERRLVEGVLVIALNLLPEHRLMLEHAGITFVGISDRCVGSWPCIGLDNVAGGDLATEFLIAHGHSRIAYVGDQFPDAYGFPTSEDRYIGYARTLRKHGIPLNPDWVRLGEHGRETAQAMTADLLKLTDPPSAIFAMSDFQALGSLAAIRAAGKRVPEDISVLGFDDIDVSRYVGLTTVRQHLQDSGRLGIQLLLSLLDKTPLADDARLKPFEIVVRDTVGSVA